MGEPRFPGLPTLDDLNESEDPELQGLGADWLWDYQTAIRKARQRRAKEAEQAAAKGEAATGKRRAGITKQAAALGMELPDFAPPPAQAAPGVDDIMRRMSQGQTLNMAEDFGRPRPATAPDALAPARAIAPVSGPAANQMLRQAAGQVGAPSMEPAPPPDMAGMSAALDSLSPTRRIERLREATGDVSAPPDEATRRKLIDMANSLDPVDPARAMELRRMAAGDKPMPAAPAALPERAPRLPLSREEYGKQVAIQRGIPEGIVRMTPEQGGEPWRFLRDADGVVPEWEPGKGGVRPGPLVADRGTAPPGEPLGPGPLGAGDQALYDKALDLTGVLGRGPVEGGVLDLEHAPPGEPLKAKPRILADTGTGYRIKHNGVDTWVSKAMFGPPDEPMTRELEAHLAERAKGMRTVRPGTMQGLAVTERPGEEGTIAERRRRESMTVQQRAAEDNEARRRANLVQKADALAPEHRDALNETIKRNDTIEQGLPPKERAKFRIARAKIESDAEKFYAKIQSDRVSTFDKAREARSMQASKTADMSRLRREQAALQIQVNAAKGTQQAAAQERLARVNGELDLAREQYKTAARFALAANYANTDVLRTVINSINEWATDDEFAQLVKDRYNTAMQQAAAQRQPAPMAPNPPPQGQAAPPARGGLTPQQVQGLQTIINDGVSSPERKDKAQEILTRAGY